MKNKNEILKEKIELLRQKLVDAKLYQANEEEVLEISRELDKLIILSMHIKGE